MAVSDPKTVFLLQVVAYNHARFLPALLTSLRQQTEQRFVVCIFDNNSHDQTKHLLSAYDMTGIGQGVSVIRNYTNIGFGSGHNHLLKMRSDGDIVGVMNPDMVLPPDFLESVLKEMNKKSNTVFHGMRLQRCEWNPETVNIDIPAEDIPLSAYVSYSTIIDSLGLKMSCIGTATDMHAGADWTELSDSYPKNNDVFGVSGACFFIKRSDIPKVAFDGDKTLFHPDIFAYKEDVELMWRAQERGYGSVTHSNIVVYHFRRIYGSSNFFARILEYLKRDRRIGYLSYLNQLRVLAEHYRWWAFFPYGIAMVIFEGRALFRLLLGQWYVMRAWGVLLVDTVDILKRRYKNIHGSALNRKTFLAWCKNNRK